MTITVSLDCEELVGGFESQQRREKGPLRYEHLDRDGRIAFLCG